jgi:FkbM family methyltransferase
LDAELEFPENVALLYTTPLFWNGPDAYEAPTSRTIALLAGRSKLFLDVGSNIGIYAVYAGVKFPQVQTIAFEPVPAIWKKNCAFHRANHLSDTITRNLALSDRDGPRQIFMPVFSTGLEEEQTATLNEHSWQAHEEKVEAIEIQCLTLDTFAASNQLPAGMCCLKIDVEGFEAAVLRGGKKFIAERRPWIVCELLPCEEFDPVTRTKHNNNRAALTVLAELGYVAFAITGDGFFRMTSADFSRPRGLKDFLLAPAEKIAPDISYLALSSLAELLPPS